MYEYYFLIIKKYFANMAVDFRYSFIMKTAGKLYKFFF